MKKLKIAFLFILLVLILVDVSLSDKVKKTDKKDKKVSTKKKNGLTGFIVGRLNPDPGFELNRLNGFYTPDEAANLCEKNVECAGFTFRGSKGASQKFGVKFFRFVAQKTFEDAKKGGNWIWTSYRVKRSFAAFFHRKTSTNLADAKNVDKKSVKSVEQLIEKFRDEKFVQNFKWKFSFSAISISFFEDESKIISVDELDLSDISTDDDSTQSVTIVNLGEESKVISEPLLKVDTCCSVDKEFKIEPSSDIEKMICNEISPKNFQQNFASKAKPVLLEQCSNVCPVESFTLEDLAKRFSENDGSTWTVEDSSSGKVKRIKSEFVNSNLPNVRYIQGQLGSIDSNLKSRKLILDSRNSTGPTIRDLFQELGLVPVSQLMIQRWTQNYVTSIQSSPKGSDAFVTLLSGLQHWILIPTTEKKDLERIVCSKEKEDCSKGSWIKNIFPQLRKKFEVFGEKIVEVILRPDETLYIPHGWSFVVSNPEDCLALTEFKLTDGGLELATSTLPESQIHLMKKELQDKDPLRPLWRRFTEVLKQRRSPGKYG